AILVFEQATGRRPGSARAVLVIRAAVARAHEKARLREPAHRASQVRAIHGEHLKSLTRNAANPTGDLGGCAVPGHANGILVGGQPRLAGGESVYRTQRNPRLSIRASAGGAEDVSHDGDADQRGPEHVETHPEPEQEASTRLRQRRHGSLPGTGRRCATSQATTSEICCDVNGAAAPSSRQSGIPRSERPAIT